MAKSHIDSTDYGKGIARALKVKGIQNVPNDVNIDQIQITADAMQGGFSIYEKGIVDLSTGMNPSQTIELTVFDPRETVFPKASVQNNALKETRLTGMRIRATGVNETAGHTIAAQLRYIDLSSGLVIPFVNLTQSQNAGQSQYTWFLPYMVLIPGGSYQLYNGFSWDGWIPAATSFAIQVSKQTAFAGTETLTIVSSFITVPKGCMLPK